MHRGKVYVANFGDGSISVLDAETLAPLTTIAPATGGRPTFIKTNPVTDRVIAVTYPDGMGGGNRVIVINPNERYDRGGRWMRAAMAHGDWRSTRT